MRLGGKTVGSGCSVVLMSMTTSKVKGKPTLFLIVTFRCQNVTPIPTTTLTACYDLFKSVFAASRACLRKWNGQEVTVTARCGYHNRRMFGISLNKDHYRDFRGLQDFPNSSISWPVYSPSIYRTVRISVAIKPSP